MSDIDENEPIQINPFNEANEIVNNAHVDINVEDYQIPEDKFNYLGIHNYKVKTEVDYEDFQDEKIYSVSTY